MSERNKNKGAGVFAPGEEPAGGKGFMEGLRKKWDRVIDELVKGLDLSRSEAREDAYQRCVRYAEAHMRGDLWCNAFLARAAERLGTMQVMRDVIREIVPMPEEALLHAAFDQNEGMIITGNREGLKYLSELLQVLAEAPCFGEHFHLYWDDPPLIGETYSCVFYLEDDQWFEDYAEDYYSSTEGEPQLRRRPLRAEQVMAIQFLVPIASALQFKTGKIYLVRKVEKRTGDETWQKPLREDDSRFFIFTIRDEEGNLLKLGLDLDDPEVNFLTREDLEQFLQ